MTRRRHARRHVFFTNLLTCGHHGQELVKVNSSIAIGIDVVDELTDLLGLGIHAKGLHGNLKLVNVDGAGAIGIEKVECLLDLLNLKNRVVSDDATFDLTSATMWFRPKRQIESPYMQCNERHHSCKHLWSQTKRGKCEPDPV